MLLNVNNCLNTNIYFYLETSGGHRSNPYLNVVHFSTPELIRNLWQLKTAVFLHWCLLCAVPLYKKVVDKMSVDKMSVDKMSVDKMSVDKMSVVKMSVDKLSVDMMSVDMMSVDMMSLDMMSVEMTYLDMMTVEIRTL
jgi:pentapeptide MXKDX repeat protein